MSDTVAPLESATWALLTPVPPGGSVLWIGPAGGALSRHAVSLPGVFGVGPILAPSSRAGRPRVWSVRGWEEAVAMSGARPPRSLPLPRIKAQFE
jgi:hypothetical protein